MRVQLVAMRENIWPTIMCIMAVSKYVLIVCVVIAIYCFMNYLLISANPLMTQKFSLL